MLVIGLMSGTSADAVDAALVEWPEGPAARPFALRAFLEAPLEPGLQQRIHQLAAGRAEHALAELAELDVLLGERFAEAAQAVAAQAGVPLERVAAIASHGQTVAHHPEFGAGLQIASPARIAERTGCVVAADFRPRDMAAGGEGAPLAPFFHHAVLGDAEETRLVLNLGGIANLTLLPAGDAGAGVRAFDVGPACALLDSVAGLASDGAERMDRGGKRAATGRVDEALLAELLDDAYLRRPPPKSTGRERYGPAQAEALLAQAARRKLSPADLLATLTAFSAEAVARALRDHLGAPRPAPRRILLGGGGALNPVLVEALRVRTGLPLENTDALGVPLAAMEAMAFSLMGRNTLLGLPGHLPHTTGARSARVLGSLTPGNAGHFTSR